MEHMAPEDWQALLTGITALCDGLGLSL